MLQYTAHRGDGPRDAVDNVDEPAQAAAVAVRSKSQRLGSFYALEPELMCL